MHVWRTPTGHEYVVDHTGTHRITTPSRPTSRLECFYRDLIVEWVA